MERPAQLFVATLLISIPLHSSAQITFQKTYGGSYDDFGVSVQQTIDGGYVIAGERSGNVYLIKTNANGDTLWTKIFGGDGDEYGFSVQQTSDTGYVIAGTAYSSGDTASDVLLIRTNSDGEMLWTKTYGESIYDEGNTVRQTNDGGFVIAGTTYSFDFSASDVYLIKTNSGGEILWTRTYGGSNYDDGNSVQQTSDGGYVIVGRAISFGAGVGDVYLIKTNAAGDTVWTRTFGGSWRDWGYSVQQTSDGGYIIAGKANGHSPGAGDGDVYLIKVNATGDTLWTKAFGGIGYDWGNCVRQTDDSGYVVAGTRDYDTFQNVGDVYLIKTNAAGDTLWTKTFGGTNIDYGYSVQQTSDGGYVIVGYTNSFGTGGFDVSLIKTDAYGNSGCHEGRTATTVTVPHTLVTSPPTVVSSQPTIVTTPATNVGSGGVVTTLCTTVSVPDDEGELFKQFELSQNYPNPFNPGTAIRFSLKQRGYVQLRVFNLLGQEITTLVDQELPAGTYQQEWDADNFSGGVYFYRLTMGSFTETKKLVLLK